MEKLFQGDGFGFAKAAFAGKDLGYPGVVSIAGIIVSTSP